MGIMNLTTALIKYKTMHPKATPEQISSFIAGWTACEIANDKSLQIAQSWDELIPAIKGICRDYNKQIVK